MVVLSNCWMLMMRGWRFPERWSLSGVAPLRLGQLVETRRHLFDWSMQEVEHDGIAGAQFDLLVL